MEYPSPLSPPLLLPPPPPHLPPTSPPPPPMANGAVPWETFHFVTSQLLPTCPSPGARSGATRCEFLGPAYYAEKIRRQQVSTSTTTTTALFFPQSAANNSVNISATSSKQLRLDGSSEDSGTSANLKPRFCPAPVPTPDISGSLSSSGQLETATSPCRHRVYDVDQLTDCLENVWLVVVGGSNSILMAMQMANQLADGTFHPTATKSRTFDTHVQDAVFAKGAGGGGGDGGGGAPVGDRPSVERVFVTVSV